jgi:hypothetical protein
MAERALLRVPRIDPAAEQRRRADQFERRNMRIAIRQLERAELYLDAVESLNLEDPEVDLMLRDMVNRLRSLRQYLSKIRSAT